MQNIYTVQYFVFYILPLVIFVKKVVYRREMMGEYLVWLVGVEILSQLNRLYMSIICSLFFIFEWKGHNYGIIAISWKI